ncbi:MAG: DUF4198 domain-containing protein [Cardiobacteriaceae bacterium]|nr:DUF4198 domain-containing protein [Cardiobacteriaceae bacterium]
MKRTKIAILCTTLVIAGMASAHNVWIRPSSTQLAGESDYVTIDGGGSDFPFDVNHRGRPAEGLHAYDPKGKEIEKENLMVGKLRTSYDVKLNQQGTYHFTDGLEYIQFNYPDENGKSVRWRDTPEKFKKENPMADKKREKFKQQSWNVETFVTLGEPTSEVLKPDSKGLDIEYLTHPNELYAGEPARFRLLFNGKPLPDSHVEIARDSLRYRENNLITLKTDKDGVVTINWPGPGMYWLYAEHETTSDLAKDAPYSLKYAAGLEVLPL